MNELPQQLANGLILGAMYGLIAIGYTMVYGIIQLINFAHGEIFMIGGFGALTVYLGLPSGFSLIAAIPLMIVGGVIAAVAISMAAERFAYRPLRGGPRLAPLITAIGLSLALQQAVWMWYPDATKDRSFPQFEGEAFDVLGATIQRGDIFVLVVAPLCMLALGFFVSKTRAGRGMQATSQDPDTAKLMGINTDRIIVMAFAIGAAFAAVAAVAVAAAVTPPPRPTTAPPTTRSARSSRSASPARRRSASRAPASTRSSPSRARPVWRPRSSAAGRAASRAAAGSRSSPRRSSSPAARPSSG